MYRLFSRILGFLKQFFFSPQNLSLWIQRKKEEEEEERIEGNMCDYLPPEVISSNILTRLPIKTLLRCTSVCKSWYSLITNSPSFITNHMIMNAKNHTPRLLVTRNINHNEEVGCSVHCDDDTFKECDKLDFPFSSIKESFRIIGSCNGLVCLSDDYFYTIILWNPSLRKSLTLPKPNMLSMSHGSSYMHSIGFGFIPTTNDYKVVRVVYVVFRAEVEVYELSTRSWRNVNAGDFPYVVRDRSPQVLLNGVIHWIGHNSNMVGGSFDRVIVSFDLTNEEFGILMVPTSLQNERRLSVGTFGESVSLIHRAHNSSVIWVMNEYGVANSWTKLFTIDDPGREKIGKVLHFRENGDILFVRQFDDFMFGEGDLVSYDPKSRQIRDLGLHGARHLLYVITYKESLVFIKA